MSPLWYTSKVLHVSRSKAVAREYTVRSTLRTNNRTCATCIESKARIYQTRARTQRFEADERRDRNINEDAFEIFTTCWTHLNRFLTMAMTVTVITIPAYRRPTYQK